MSAQTYLYSQKPTLKFLGISPTDVAPNEWGTIILIANEYLINYIAEFTITIVA